MGALSDPLSKRRLGTRSGELARLSRGSTYRGARSALEMESAKARIGEGGITSADDNRTAQALDDRLQRGLMESRRRLLFDQQKPAPEKKPLTAAEQQKSRMEYYRRVNGQPAAPANGTPAAPAPAKPSMVPGKSPIVQGPPAPTPAPREGRIDGMPASEAIRRSTESLRSGGPMQEYGKDVATANVEKLGVAGAIADYQRRDALDKGRAARGAAYRAAEAVPGSLRGGIPEVGPAKPGPLQAALNANNTQSRLDAAGPPPVVGPPKPPPVMGPPKPAPSLMDARPIASAPASAPAAPAKPFPTSAPMTQYDSQGRSGADLPAYYTPKTVPVYGSSTAATTPSDILKPAQKPLSSTGYAPTTGGLKFDAPPPATPTPSPGPQRLGGSSPGAVAGRNEGYSEKLPALLEDQKSEQARLDRVARTNAETEQWHRKADKTTDILESGKKALQDFRAPKPPKFDEEAWTLYQSQVRASGKEPSKEGFRLYMNSRQ